MDSVIKSKEALDILAGISLAELVIIIAIIIGAIAFVWKSKDKIKEVFEDYRKKENSKEAKAKKIDDYDERITKLEAHHEEDIHKMIENQKTYRQQSLDKQQAIDNHFNSIESKIDSLIDSINEMRAENQEIKKANNKIKCSELRDRLLQMHRYYTSLETNPRQEWTEAAQETFESLYNDYTALGGNGHMHSQVKPDMDKLTIIYF